MMLLAGTKQKRRGSLAVLVPMLALLSTCENRSITHLPTEPYLYACSDGAKTYLFMLPNPQEHVAIDSGTELGPLWFAEWRTNNVAAEEGRYLVVGSTPEFLDILSVERFIYPPPADARYSVSRFESSDRFYQFFTDDYNGDWQTIVVNSDGEVLEDLGLKVGYHISPDFEWSYGTRSAGPEDTGSIWVQRLRGGTPYRLTNCPYVDSLAPLARLAWYPDSKHLIYFTPVSTTTFAIYRCGVEDDQMEELYKSSDYSPLKSVSLSVDYRRLAFTTEWRGEDLYALDIESGEVVTMHEGRSYHFFDWTRDGRYLLVEVDDGSPAGEGPKKLISFPEGTTYPVDGSRYPCWPIQACPGAFTLDDVGSQAIGP